MFPMAPAFYRLIRGDKVRIGIAKPTIARQHIRPTLFYRAISTVPIDTIFANRNHCTPRSLRFCWLETDEPDSKGGDGS
jgi:hypothetical protein